eukprot:2927680-Pyramimonas_sp.AAC.1
MPTICLPKWNSVAIHFSYLVLELIWKDAKTNEPLGKASPPPTMLTLPLGDSPNHVDVSLVASPEASPLTGLVHIHVWHRRTRVVERLPRELAAKLRRSWARAVLRVPSR